MFTTLCKNIYMAYVLLMALICLLVPHRTISGRKKLPFPFCISRPGLTILYYKTQSRCLISVCYMTTESMNDHSLESKLISNVILCKAERAEVAGVKPKTLQENAF